MYDCWKFPKALPHGPSLKPMETRVPSTSAYSEHIKEIEAIGMGLSLPISRREQVVLGSWRRCIEHHGLDPTANREAYIVPAGMLRQHREQAQALIGIARSGLEHLYRQLTGLDYVLLLADCHGITVDFLGREAYARELRQAGLYLGSEWREERAGTCAVGTCIATGEALTVHRSDHFDFTHTPLSCTAAPIYDLDGELAAVLDLSLLHAPMERASQSLALHLVNATARRVELANLMAQSRTQWVLRLSQSPDFLDVDPEAALTIDDGGLIRGMTHAGARMLVRAARLSWCDRHSVLGQPLQRFFALDVNQLPLLLRNRPTQERVVRAHDGSVLFVHAIEPQKPPRKPQTVSSLSAVTALPQPLASLSAGDPVMDALLLRAARLAPSALPILIQGETGSGKEYLARALHAASGRSGPLVAINCAAIPETLLESELFGYLPGSWSGAAGKGRIGLIETADGGSLFLDEIGDLPLALQAKLLRVLSEGEVMPLGARQPRKLNLRILCASHKPLDALVAQGLFRQDLLYRLNAATLYLPALRERQDMDTLIQRLMIDIAPLTLDAQARERLHTYAWPGNLRELHNALRYAAALADAGRIGAEHLPPFLQEPGRQADTTSPVADLSTLHDPAASFGAVDEAQRLEQLLSQCSGNVSEVARLLGVNRSTVHRRIQRLQLGQRQARWGAG